MARISRTRYAILFLLKNSPMSGYDIRKACGRFTGHFWTESFGQIYPALARMESEGLVEALPRIEEGRRIRKVYQVTDQGISTLRRWLEEPPGPLHVRDELLLKLSCGHEVEPAVHLGHLEDAREQARRRLQEFVDLEITYLAEYRTAPDLPYWMITLRAGRSAWEARMRWCDESIATLKAL